MLFYAAREVEGDKEVTLLLQTIDKKARLAGRAQVILALDEMADIRGDRSVDTIAAAMAKITAQLNNKE